MNRQTLLRPILLVLGLTLASAALYTRARAGGDDFFPPVQDARTLSECGSCHFAYPAALLPAASWQKMMRELDRHFGSDASLDPASTAAITRYLVEHAGDTGGSAWGRKMLRGLPADAVPERITQLPRWERKHRKVPARDWNKKEVGSKANCPACHKGAEKGYFEDD